MRKWITRTAAALAACAALGAGANTYTDLWWNPNEAGWGANIVQQGESAFVTLFVYGADGKATWLVAPAMRTFALDNAGLPVMRGELYRTQGPWQGGPFNPGSVVQQRVGTLVLEPQPGGSLRAYYDVDGVDIEKGLVRYSFETPSFGTNYHGSFNLRQTLPGQAPYGTRQYPAQILFHLSEGQLFMRVEEQFGRCEYRGTYSQGGKFARVSGTYSCNYGDGPAGTFEITDFEIAKHGISGYLRTWAPSNYQYGRFGGALY